MDITLLRDGEVCDTYSLKHGIRMIELDADNYIAWDKMYQTMMRDYGTEDGTLASGCN